MTRYSPAVMTASSTMYDRLKLYSSLYFRVSSVMRITEQTDVSLNSAMKSLVTGGMTIRSACGMMITRSAVSGFGGDVRAIGGQPDGSPWRVGIRDPRAPNRAVALLEVDDGAVATSGDYERYFDLDGRRYCHILDPRSGMPVVHWRSVSVVAPLCVVAGSSATIAMLFEERAPAFLDAQQFYYLAIDATGKLHRSAHSKAAST